jgi:hypothetical protein
MNCDSIICALQMCMEEYLYISLWKRYLWLETGEKMVWQQLSLNLMMHFGTLE